MVGTKSFGTDGFSREKILGYGIVDHKFLRIVDVLPRHVFFVARHFLTLYPEGGIWKHLA